MTRRGHGVPSPGENGQADKAAGPQRLFVSAALRRGKQQVPARIIGRFLEGSEDQVDGVGQLAGAADVVEEHLGGDTEADDVDVEGHGLVVGRGAANDDADVQQGGFGRGVDQKLTELSREAAQGTEVAEGDGQASCADRPASTEETQVVPRRGRVVLVKTLGFTPVPLRGVALAGPPGMTEM